MEPTPYYKVNQRIRKFFDDRATNWSGIVCPEHPERLGKLIASLNIPEGSRVLDIGSGNGVLLPFLVSKSRLVVELDLSHRMLMEARSNDTIENTVFLQADTLDLPLSASSFDVILCNSCFPHFCDQQRAVNEMARCLAIGGRLVICHTQSRECINAHHRKAGDTVRCHELPDDDKMRHLMRNAGLDVLELTNTHDRYCMVSIHRNTQV